MSVLLRIFHLAARHRWRLAGVYTCMVAGTAAFLTMPKLFGHAIDRVAGIVSGGSYSETSVLVLVASILGVAAIQGLFGFGQTYLAEALGEATVYDIRNTFFDKVQHLSFGFHDKQHTGNLMSRAITDVESVRVFVNVGLVLSPYLLGLFVVVAVLLVRLDWRLGLLTASFMPVVGLLSVFVRLRLGRIWLSVMEHMSGLSTVLQENLTGVMLVRAFAIEDYEMRKYEAKNAAVKGQMVKAARWQAFNNSLIGLSFFTVMGLTLWVGGTLVVRAQMSAGELAQFLFYLQILTVPVWNMAGLVTGVARAIPAGRRLFEVIDTESPVREKLHAIEMVRVKGHVRYENVSFAYDRDRFVLTDVNIDAEPGKVVALVGAPGSGKSTIASLLPRFYDVTSGRITIDGIDVGDMTLKSLRRDIGMVQQDVFVFTATIAENIAYGRDNATMDEIIAAAQVAQLHDFVQSLDDGYNSLLSERGANLSGGQRQRLSIARAILLDPPILVLDDSTASVDAHTEEEIRKAMESVMRGRTTFVIANRLNTVHKADEILVLAGGKIVERGSHTELLRNGGRYREIYDLQLRPQEELLHEVRAPSVVIQEAS